jgi:hypothetical protein
VTLDAAIVRQTVRQDVPAIIGNIRSGLATAADSIEESGNGGELNVDL